MIKDNILADLFEKFASGNLNSEEEKLLSQWASESPLNEEMLRLMSGESEYGDDIKKMLSYNEDAAWQRVKRHSLRNALSNRAVFSIVASLLIISTVAFAWIQSEKIRVIETIAAIEPGTSKAQFTMLDEGGQMLGSWMDESLNLGNALSMNSALSINNDSVKQIKVTTHEGCEYEYLLPDGTKVWLNASSSVTYPKNFNGDKRLVSMSGEVYFDVAKDANRPFIIDVAEHGQIKVLGTSFNVKAYDNEPNVETTLVEGEISITGARGNHATLSPGMLATISREGKELDVETVDPEPNISWKDGYFLFDNEDFGGICNEFGRWYNIDIRVESAELAAERYSLRLLRETRFSEVLNILRSTRDISVRVSNDNVIHLY